jgi:hypothetical protein
LKGEQDEIGKKGHLLLFQAFIVLGLHVFYLVLNSLLWTYFIAVGAYYLVAFAKRRANKKEFKSSKELRAKMIMPWLYGFVFAGGVVAILYGFLSSNARALWMDGIIFNANIIDVALYFASYLTVLGLLAAFQHAISRDAGQEKVIEHYEKRGEKHGQGRY